MHRETDGYSQMSTHESERLISLIASNPRASRIFLTMVNMMDKWNRCHNSQGEISEKVGIRCNHVSELIKYLDDNGFIKSDGRGRNRVYHVDPNLFWKNKTSLRQSAIQRWLDMDTTIPFPEP